MATAGYSGIPLVKKLGIDKRMKIYLINVPTNYMQLLEQDIKGLLIKNDELPDLVHLFVSSKKSLKKK